jgi:hypothetical protein
MKDRATTEVLLTTSDLQVQSAATAWKHVRAEYVDVVDDILATLAPSGPYAYTVTPRVEEGHELPTQRIVTTYEEIEHSYRSMHRYAAVVAIRPVAEINTSWYTFVSGVGRGREKQTGAESERPVVVIFPTMGSEGITGELFWGRTQQDSMPGDTANGALASRFACRRGDCGERWVMTCWRLSEPARGRRPGRCGVARDAVPGRRGARVAAAPDACT